MPPEPVDLFYSYSHKDEKLRDELAVHLTMLQRQGVISTWHDRNISAGSEWAKEIDQNLNSAQIILLLVSANFLASDYCYSIEMQRAIERHEAGEACVIPIILRPVEWSGAPFGKLQALPKNARPVTEWKAKAFVDIVQGIQKAAEEIRERSPLPASIPSAASVPPSKLLLENPEGSVGLDSPLYVERPPIEATCYQEIRKPGALILVKAPRQMGKTSLMQRTLHQAQQHGQRSVYLNLQSIDIEFLDSIDQFLQWFCASVANELELDDRLDQLWKGVVGSKNKCTNYFQRYLLPTVGKPLTLGLDEVDQVFHHLKVAQGFFGLLRSWHEKSKNDPTWQQFRLVIAHSREVYIPLNINHSPFNVGVPMELPTLNPSQVEDLVQRHGLPWSAEAIAQLINMVDGHPYLVRKALFEIARGNLTLEQFLAIAPTEEGLYSDHLRNHLNNLHYDPQLAEAMKQVVTSETPVRVESSVGFRLHSMGLVQRRKNDIEPLCNLYRIYFRDRLEVG
ncbi:MAG: TIR domain-containing protein [Leptolyngbyaceae cyanobacterium SM1_4_3]|nr:TIR domain-containing protein [Leptolyngbyaceae cyanobacterium SM1_4_3]